MSWISRSRFIPVVFALCLSVPSVAQAWDTWNPYNQAATATATDEAAIRDVMARFRQALADKSRPGLEALFYDGVVVWRTSGHPASRAAVQQMTGQTLSAVEEQGAYQLLAGSDLAPFTIEERFYNPQIRTDGQIATVTFDYDFTADGQLQNWGQESWQMVKTTAGWRILHLLFSYRIQAVEPAPAVR